MLEVKDLKVRYGAIQGLKGISFKINQGEIVSLIGSNGAGKTTTLRALSGIVESSGLIEFKGKNISAVPSHLRVNLGIAQSPEGRGIFPAMSVKENLELGAYSRKDKAQIAKDYERCLQLFPRVKERLWQMAGTLSGGEQQMLSICRAMMCKPELLLLDEPSLGLAPLIVAQIFEIVKLLNSEGMTILLVEQNAKQSLTISHRAYVLETGLITLQGTGRDLLKNDEVRRSYLGI